jgi:hypothetical protein
MAEVKKYLEVREASVEPEMLELLLDENSDWVSAGLGNNGMLFKLDAFDSMKEHLEELEENKTLGLLAALRQEMEENQCELLHLKG